MALEEERPICMVTVLDADAPGVEQGNRLVVHRGGQVEGTLGDDAVDPAATEAARELLEREKSEIRTLPGSSGQARAFVEGLEPPLRLLLRGAGLHAAPRA